jgi:hypothetical protein
LTLTNREVLLGFFGMKMKESTIANRVAVYVPNHPAANNRGYVLRYRYVMEQHLGRVLNPDENVHHKNGDCRDDRLENLEVISRSAHMTIHWENGETKLGRPGNVNVEEILRIRKETGFGCRRISSMLGCSKKSVQVVFKKYGA